MGLYVFRTPKKGFFFQDFPACTFLNYNPIDSATPQGQENVLLLTISDKLAALGSYK